MPRLLTCAALAAVAAADPPHECPHGQVSSYALGLAVTPPQCLALSTISAIGRRRVLGLAHLRTAAHTNVRSFDADLFLAGTDVAELMLLGNVAEGDGAGASDRCGSGSTSTTLPDATSPTASSELAVVGGNATTLGHNVVMRSLGGPRAFARLQISIYQSDSLATTYHVRIPHKREGKKEMPELLVFSVGAGRGMLLARAPVCREGSSVDDCHLAVSVAVDGDETRVSVAVAKRDGRLAVSSAPSAKRVVCRDPSELAAPARSLLRPTPVAGLPVPQNDALLSPTDAVGATTLSAFLAECPELAMAVKAAAGRLEWDTEVAARAAGGAADPAASGTTNEAVQAATAVAVQRFARSVAAAVSAAARAHAAAAPAGVAAPDLPRAPVDPLAPCAHSVDQRFARTALRTVVAEQVAMLSDVMRAPDDIANGPMRRGAGLGALRRLAAAWSRGDGLGEPAAAAIFASKLVLEVGTYSELRERLTVTQGHLPGQHHRVAEHDRLAKPAEPAARARVGEALQWLLGNGGARPGSRPVSSPEEHNAADAVGEIGLRGAVTPVVKLPVALSQDVCRAAGAKATALALVGECGRYQAVPTCGVDGAVGAALAEALLAHDGERRALVEALVAASLAGQI